MPSSRRSSTARVLTATGVAVVVVVAGAVTAYASTRTESPAYRTATVSTQTVQQTLQTTGTIEPGTSATVSFPVSGTVASVRVAMGDQVSRGEVMATLGTTSLRSALAQALAQLANARLTVHKDETAQSSSTSSGGSGSGASGGSGSGSGSSGSSHGSSTKALAAAQQRLLGSVRSVDASLATATADLATATSLCGTTTPAPTASPSPSASPPPSTSPGPGGSTPPTTCAQAQALVLADETTVQRLEQSIAQQEAQLDRLLAAAAKQAAATQRSSSSSGSGSSRGGGTGTGSTTVSAAQLAADQAAVDAAQAQVEVARQDLDQAVLTSPFDGVVASVGLTVGSTATAGSSSSAIEVIDPDAHSVTLAVDVTKVPLVKVGQHATVVPDGTDDQLVGTVSYVAAAPATAGGTTYPVTLSLASAPKDLHDGIQAAVTLVVAQETGLAVPTSAVGHLGAISYVSVVDGSSTRRQLVTVGAVGPDFTEVTKGLSAGQQVVLANVDEPIPTSTLTGRFGRFAGAGGLGGLGTGGFTGGGLGGGAATGRG